MDLDELRVFVSVVDRGSLAGASKALRFPIATLRRRLNELEARLGVKLLERSRDGAVLTGAGTVLIEKARSLLGEVHALSELVRNAGSEPSGEVRVALPLGLPAPLVAACLELVTRLYPKISWQTRCSEDPAGALSSGAHIAICMTPRPPEGPWIAKKIMELDERLLATPGYLEKNGTPKTVDDLRTHRLLVWEAHGRAECELPRKDGTTLAIVPALRMNDVFLLRQAALRDLGIVFAPEGPVPLEFLFGEEALVGVLEAEVGRKTALWFLAHSTTLDLPYGRMMVDHLKRLFDSLR